MKSSPDLPPRTAGRRKLDRMLPAVVCCLVVLGAIDTVLSVAVFSQQGRTNDAAQTAKAAATKARRAAAALVIQQGRTAAAIHGSCERLQIARDDINSVSGLIYRTARRYRLPPLTHVRYLPPTDCDAAVRRPATYRAPQPVPFSTVAACYTPADPRPEPPCRTR